MKNQTILITGASSGIGLEIAEYLSKKNYTVIGTSRKKIKPKTFPIYKLDICDDISVQNCISEVISEYGRIDVLINNAGIGLAGAIEDTTVEEAKMQFETNFFGTFRLIKEVLPIMRSQNKGLIINMSSIAGLIGIPYQGFYSASKFALEGLTESLRLEVLNYDISITNINPGDYNTSFTNNKKEISNISSTVHKTQYQKTKEKITNDELNGGNPIEIAYLVEKIIQIKGKPEVRYLSCDASVKFGVRLKYIIKSKSFEKQLLKEYLIKT